MAKFKFFFFEYWHYAVIILLAAAFFIGASAFNFYSQRGGFVKWLSPDETANYTFARLYAQTGGLTIFERYNLEAQEIIHPRSFRSDYGTLKPVSFLGIILIYGKIGSLLGVKAIPYLTPFFGGIGIIFFYGLVRKIFGRSTALISAFLMTTFPVYLYYSARSMFHNVLFAVFLLGSLYFACLTPEKEYGGRRKRLIALAYAALSGGFLGLALMTRTSELLWVGPLYLLVWLFNLKSFDVSKLLLFLGFLSLAVLPAFYWNHLLYGSFWMGGYPEMNTSIAAITKTGGEIVKTATAARFSHALGLLKKMRDTIFYFGFSPRQSLKMAYYYFFKLFYWIAWPAALGLLIFFLKIRIWKKRHIIYLLSFLLLSSVLLFYYGSWGFHDNPDPKSFTIGNSYTRYWLPIYLGALPFAALAIRHAAKLLRKRYLVYGAEAALVLLISLISIKFVLAGSEEGLINSYDKQMIARAEERKVLSLTEKDSIIITQYHDKLFFPERKVIVGLFNDKNMDAQYVRLVRLGVPLYYYNFDLPEKSLDYLNHKLKEEGIGIEKVAKISKAFSLYKVK